MAFIYIYTYILFIYLFIYCPIEKGLAPNPYFFGHSHVYQSANNLILK